MTRLFLFLLFASRAVAVNFTEFYCQTSGDNLNAGSTTDNASELTLTAGDWVASTGVYTKAGSDLSGVTVGEWASVYNDGATVGVFVGRITAVDDGADTITVSLVAKSGTAPTDGTGNRSLKVGGAWKGPNAAEDFPIAFAQGTMTNSTGNSPRINFKNNALFSVTANIADALNDGPVRYQGYNATPGDGGKATIDGGTGGSGYTILTLTCKNRDFVDLIFQNNGSSGSSDGVNMGGSENSFRRCVFNNVRGHGIIVTGVNHLYQCEAYLCNQSNTSGKGGIALQASGDMALNCISHNNTNLNTSGFQLDGGVNLVNCIAASNGNSGFRATADVSQTIYNCVAYRNKGSGIDFGGAVGPIGDPMVVNVVNCSLVGNSLAGIRLSVATGQYLNGQIRNCAFGTGTMTNLTGNYNSGAQGVSTDGSTFNGVEITGTLQLAADTTPWVSPDTGNFKNTLAAIKASGFGDYTQTFTNVTWTGTVAYPDIGAAQSASTNSGGGGSYTFAQ